MTKRFLLGGLMLIALGSSSVGVRGDDTSAKADVATKAAATHPQFERMKKLVGTWVAADKDGKPTEQVVSVIKLTASGSALQETLFPGQPMEMLSIYHLDGGDLIMTHYCALGNQPRLKADPKSAPNTIHFQFTGGTNLDPTKDMHMHEGKLTFINDDTIELNGVAWKDGKPFEGPGCGPMKLIRKK